MLRRVLAVVLVALSLSPMANPARAASQLQLVIEPDQGVAPLVSFIGAAQHTVDGEVYLASSKPVLSALEAAAARHVTVRINLEQHPYGTGTAAVMTVYRSLAAAGVQVRWTSRSFTYTQFFGADVKSQRF